MRKRLGFDGVAESDAEGDADEEAGALVRDGVVCEAVRLRG